MLIITKNTKMDEQQIFLDTLNDAQTLSRVSVSLVEVLLKVMIHVFFLSPVSRSIKLSSRKLEANITYFFRNVRKQSAPFLKTNKLLLTILVFFGEILTIFFFNVLT